MSSQILLSGGDKWYSYRDSLVLIDPYFGKIVNAGGTATLGIQVKLNDVVVINSQNYASYKQDEEYKLFVPRQSKLEILSINESLNNTQIRGANLLGYYL